jgi:hypothetical protein
MGDVRQATVDGPTDEPLAAAVNPAAAVAEPPVVAVIPAAPTDEPLAAAVIPAADVSEPLAAAVIPAAASAKRPGNRKCYHCRANGHIKRDCSKLDMFGNLK